MAVLTTVMELLRRKIALALDGVEVSGPGLAPDACRLVVSEVL